MSDDRDRDHLVREVRRVTGVQYAEARYALEANAWDIYAAIDWLRWAMRVRG